jgi:phage/plasmid-associated DNA primase
VQAASDDYRLTQDALADFFDECCDIPTDPSQRDSYRQNWPEFLRAYNDFCDRNKEKPLGKIILLEHMADRGYPVKKLGVIGSAGKAKARTILGIRLKGFSPD